jgi:hypothetical protein
MTTRGGVWSGGHGLRLTCPHQARRAEETLILMSFPASRSVLDLRPGPRGRKLKSHAWCCAMNSPHLAKPCAHRATGTNSRRALFSSRHGPTSAPTKERSPNDKPLFRVPIKHSAAWKSPSPGSRGTRRLRQSCGTCGSLSIPYMNLFMQRQRAAHGIL